MKSIKLFILIILFSSPSFSAEFVAVDQSKNSDIKKMEQSEAEVIDMLNGMDLSVLDESQTEGESVRTKRLISYIVDFIDQRIFPKHLRDFSSQTINNNKDKDVFVDYRGVQGQCYQFRVFHKYTDDIVTDSQWASSILTIPTGQESNSTSVVLAPSMHGTTMFIEGGIWSQLCKRGVASLTPESFYTKRWFGGWKKLPFDPTPELDRVLDFTIYQRAIERYERLLNRNLDILRDFENLITSRDELLRELPVGQLERSKVGYWGSSLGAIVGSIVVGKDTRIKGAVLTVAGSDLPNIIAVSDIYAFRVSRRAQMDILEIDTPREYEELLRQNIFSDPVDYLNFQDRDRVFMIIGEKDVSVPLSNQLDLYEHIGRPENLLFPAGHALTLIRTAWTDRDKTDQALDFIVERLTQ